MVCDEKESDFNDAWMAPIKSMISTLPRLSFTILRSIFTPNEVDSRSDSSSYNTFIMELLESSLNEIPLLEDMFKAVEHDNDSCTNKENVVKKREVCCSIVHELLSSMYTTLPTESSKISKNIDELLMDLLYRVKNALSDYVTKSSVCCGLLSHKSLQLFQRFCSIEYDNEFNGNRVSILSGRFAPCNYLQPSKDLLTRACAEDRSAGWKLLFLKAKKDCHILEDVVVSCVK